MQRHKGAKNREKKAKKTFAFLPSLALFASKNLDAKAQRRKELREKSQKP
jgi:hypothetical protein